jgi:hypothetical protein
VTGTNISVYNTIQILELSQNFCCEERDPYRYYLPSKPQVPRIKSVEEVTSEKIPR